MTIENKHLCLTAVVVVIEGIIVLIFPKTEVFFMFLTVVLIAIGMTYLFLKGIDNEDWKK